MLVSAVDGRRCRANATSILSRSDLVHALVQLGAWGHCEGSR